MRTVFYAGLVPAWLVIGVCALLGYHLEPWVIAVACFSAALLNARLAMEPAR